jgi:BirA family transcriptional regulator, biotin operon repressor / biotin---[acetyl-CoA-carboxylase] ligase
MFESVPDELAASLSAAASDLGDYARVHYRAEVGSTNDLALALAAQGVPEGVSVLADVQRSGRGRRGREWYSPPGSGLYLSVVVRPQLSADVLPVLTLAAGVAVARAVRAVTGLPAELKWPNDLVIGRPWRKLGGILSEAASSGTRLNAVVIGIGVNLAQTSYPPELASRATSLESELGRRVERAPLLVGLLGELRDVMARLHTGGRESVCREWRTYGGAGLADAVVRWDDRTGLRRGRAVDIADDGALLVRVGPEVERVIAGEVIWEFESR